MLDNEGRVAEGSSANVFAWIDGVWCTPPLDVGILGGITRSTILRVMDEKGIAVKVGVLWPDDLKSASEIFLCSSVREMLPVVTLDGEKVGEGVVGQEYRKVRALYHEEVERQIDCGGE